ncbi:MAG: hypothetical protein ACXVKA_08105 [Acidimicrobiia bacterium]
MVDQHRLLFVNKSSYPTATIPMDEMCSAVNQQLEHFAEAWGSVTWELTRDLDRQGFRIVLFDHTDEKDAAAYHSQRKGKPYASVFARDILEDDGTWTKGANSVSCAASHEVVELLADPVCNFYVDKLDGYMYALEIADPTQGDSYNIDGVAVSNFVYPAYWNPWATKRRGHKLDRMGVITKPFEVRSDGYLVRYKGDQDATIWGESFSDAKQAMKRRKPHGRTRVRLEEIAKLTRPASKARSTGS